MMLKLSLVAVICSAMAGVGATAQEANPGDVGALLQRSFEAQVINAAIEQEMNAATQAVRTELTHANGELRTIRRPPTDEQVQRLREQLERHREQAAALEARLAAMDLDDDAKATRQAELQDRVQQLQAQQREQEAPFKARRDAALAEVMEPTDGDALQALLADHLRSHDGFAPKLNTGRPEDGFLSASWQNDDRERLAWMHVRLRAEPGQHATRLAGRYPVQSQDSRSIWVWAGHFLLTFVADDADAFADDDLAEVLQACVDLEGLAAIKPAE